MALGKDDRKMKIGKTEHCFLLPQAHALFAQCHASTIAKLPDGELLAAFFAGEREGAGDVAIWLARTAGGIWQMPRRSFAEDGLAHWNPVLHVAADSVWIFYKVGATVHDWTTRCAQSFDLGLSWSASRPLVPGDTRPRGPVRNKLIVAANGDWIAPGSVETDEFWDAFVDVSADQGRTWSQFDVPIDHRAGASVAGDKLWTGLADNALWETDVKRIFKWDGVIQPTLWESAPGKIHMLMRSTRGRIYRSDSSDAGLSWCAAYATGVANNNSGIDLARRHDGSLVLALNPVAGNWGRRYPISLAASVDNGEHWTTMLDLETDAGEFSYPAIIADGDALHLTYTWNRKNIACWKITLET